ncbi:MAG: hypothetical protein GC171_15940 [Terrimonas sp.]|nr:hypothetical protein [Terrimonas sp.]
MKALFHKLFFISALAVALGSCKKDEAKDFFEGGTNPVLTASLSGSIPLSYATEGNNAIDLNWTNPDYRFTSGISSQDVNYTLEIDTVGANFTNPNKVTIVISKELSRSFIQSQFNDYLLNTLLLVPGMQHNIEMRVKSALSGDNAVLISNVLQFQVTPYAIPPKVAPPASGNLYITGSATPASWMGGGDPELVSQKFNKISTTLFELPSIALTGGGSYLFVPVYGDWGNKYGFTGANNTNNVNGDDFKKEGGDMLAPAASGNYKITVDFQRGKFTVVKL